MISQPKKKKEEKKEDTGSWEGVLKFLYLCQSPCPERAHAWRKLKATALRPALLPIQARRNLEVNSQPVPVLGGLRFPYDPNAGTLTYAWSYIHPPTALPSPGCFPWGSHRRGRALNWRWKKVTRNPKNHPSQEESTHGVARRLRGSGRKLPGKREFPPKGNYGAAQGELAMGGT